jgi:uncharacterized FlaG/YvyC family protein
LNQTECEQANEENNTVEECTSENERTEAKMQNPGEHQSRNQIENKISDTNKGHQSCGKYLPVHIQFDSILPVFCKLCMCFWKVHQHLCVFFLLCV